MILLILLSLYSLSYSSILDYISNPDEYSNCLADYLTLEQCQGVNGEWEEIEPKNCENKDFFSERTKIGICCNMKCLTENGNIIIKMEKNKVCKYNKNKENFYGFKDYTSFNRLFKERINYTEENEEYTVFQNLTNNKEDFISVYCSFPKKEDFIKGLSNIMIENFDYLYGGGHQDGPSQDINNQNIIGFDCNRLVMFLLDKVSDFKFDFTISSDDLYQIAVTNNYIKSTEDLEIGDVLFYKNTTTNKVFHDGIYIGENKKIHASGVGTMIKKGNAIYKQENVIILAADFINIKKEDSTEENDEHGFTGTQGVNSSQVNEIKDTELFSIRIKLNIFTLLGIILFL